MRRLRLLATMTVVAMLASVSVVSPARAQTDFEVWVGAFHERSPAETMVFMPDRIRVHQGDKLTFLNSSFHTATLLPSGTDVSDWLNNNASKPGDPFYLLQPDTDDGADALKYNLAVAGPTTPFCGDAGTPCDFDATSLLSSGLPLAGPMEFNVTVNAGANSAFWVVCLVHQNMRMRVNVVSNAAEPSDPATIAAERDAQIETNEDDALALHRKLKDRKSFHRTPSGKKVWDAWAGFDTHQFSLYDMYPNKLTIEKGERVRWHFGQLGKDDHTVSLSRQQAIAQILSQDFQFVCDPDGGGPGPDNPPDLDDFPFCNDPTQLEIDAAPNLVGSVGNGKWVSGSDLEHSGIRGALVKDWNHYTIKFRKTTKQKGVAYMCVLHPWMVGRVQVKP